jgi:hypothetical protein
MCKNYIPIAEQAIYMWKHKAGGITDAMLIQAYKCMVALDFLTNNLCQAFEELIIVTEYYRSCTNTCLHESTTILEVLESFAAIVLEKKPMIIIVRCDIQDSIFEAEDYFNQYNIAVITFKNQVKKEIGT